jgi:hypothetical protein
MHNKGACRTILQNVLAMQACKLASTKARTNHVLLGMACCRTASTFSTHTTFRSPEPPQLLS